MLPAVGLGALYAYNTTFAQYTLVYMGVMYVLAIVIYGGARIIRNRQGIDLGLINKEIPLE